MRKAAGALRKCPVCGGANTSIGLRNYKWLTEHLPFSEGCSDIDMVYEKGGHVLMLEFKPGGSFVPKGQRILFKALVKLGIDVWVVFEQSTQDSEGLPLVVTVAEVNKRGDLSPSVAMPLERLKDRILDWRQSIVRDK